MEPPPDGLQTIEVNGKARTFIIHAPKTYDSSKRYPLMFGFHGASRTATDFDNDKGGLRLGPTLGDRTVVSAQVSSESRFGARPITLAEGVSRIALC